MFPRYFCFVVLIVLVVSCGKKNQFEEKKSVRIADLQDRRVTDSLLLYLNSEDTAEQRAAAIALGSVQDTTAVRPLGALLKKGSVEAAFSLGQINGKRSVVQLASAEFWTPELGREVLEALGKVASKQDLYDYDVFKGISPDSTLQSGVAWGIYRAGIRGVSDSSTTQIARSILQTKDFGRNARLGAAHYFARGVYTVQPGISQALSEACSDPDVEIRMAAVSALVKMKNTEVIAALSKAVSDSDYRVRVSAARSLRTQPWDTAKVHFEKLLADPSANVTIAASEVIAQTAPAKDSTLLADWATKAREWRTQANLFGCLLKISVSPDAVDQIKTLVGTTSNPYQKAALITALSEDTENLSLIAGEYPRAKDLVVKSTIADAITRIDKRSGFPKALRPLMAATYQSIIEDGDHGAIVEVSGALGDSTLGYKKLITDYSFLEIALGKLSLPRDYETYVPLQRTLNYFKGLPPPLPLKNKYNHPIDWTLAATIADDDHVIIETNKGDIVMRLLIAEAPGSVVNFVSMVNSKYFDGKVFHRVVPNFVVQTGCNRGDGFGSEDYSIRSEFSRRKFKTGSVGMASAGKDTEGTQWFITHSPTPHLDGKYTIFAEVVSGMEVVHKLEVGDRIITARLADHDE